MRKALITCFFSLITTLLFSQKVYTFNGNGKWSDSLNWVNKLVPPVILDSGSQIIIDPIATGECLLDTLQFLTHGAFITVQSGKKLTLLDNMVINPIENRMGCDPSNLDSLLLVPVLDTSKLIFLRPKSLTKSFELSMPTDFDFPEIGFQGSQGSCTAWASAYTTRSYYLHKNHCTIYGDDSKVLSPAFLFNIGNSDPANCDKVGMSIYTALSIMKRQGVCTMKSLEYDDKVCSLPLNPAVYENATIYKIDGFERIIDISQNNIKYILNSGNPIMICIKLDWLYWKFGDYIWTSNRASNEVGLHAVVVCGWDDSKHAYKIINSYGKSWGYNGFGWIDYDFFKKVVYGTSVSGDFGDWEMFVMKTSPNFSVNFRFDPSPIVKGSPVTFRDFTEPEPTTREWSFPSGNPASSTALLPTVTYDKPGIYKVSLKVTPCSNPNKSSTKDSLIIVNGPEESFTDPRDGQVYTYRQIGSQVWMTKNLNFAAPGSFCYDDNAANCTVYGRLYDWNTALTVAPPGWHLPSDEEWTTLTDFLGGEAVAGGAMKATSGWNSPNVGATNSSGFSGYPGGAWWGDIQFVEGFLGQIGVWWSATESSSLLANYRCILNDQSNISSWELGPAAKIDGFSVRCIKD